MTNIFEKAYFGMPYRTRDGRKALYIGDFVNDKISLLTEQNGTIWVSIDGHSNYKYNDIVSEWQEDIDKDKVYNCAKDAFKHSAFKSDDAWGEAVYCTGYHEGWCDAIKTIQCGNDT